MLRPLLRRDRRSVLSLALPSFLAVGLAACGDSSSSDADGAPEIQLRLVEIGLVHHPKPLPEGGFPDLGGPGESRIFDNDGGQTVQLDVAELSVQSFTLFECPESVERVARDHDGGDAPALLFEATDDIVAVEDLVAQTKTYEVGAGPFCEVRMTVGPTSLFGEDRPAFRFEGSCSDDAGTRDFALTSAGVLEKDFTILGTNEFGEKVPTALDPTAQDFVRSEDDDTVQDLIFGTAYPALFDGIDCVSATEAELLAHVTGRVASNTPVHQHLGALRAFQGF